MPRFPTFRKGLLPPLFSSRRRTLVRLPAMFALVLLVCYLAASLPLLVSFPVELNVKTLELVPDLEQLQNFVDSPSNKAIFSKLQHSDNAFYDSDQNVVGTLDFVTFHQYQRQPYVANGFLGARVPVLGQGFAFDTLSDEVSGSKDDLSNGWPLFNERYAGAFAAGFYDAQVNTTESNFPWLNQYGYESVISAIPQWTSLHVSSSENGNTYTLDPQLPPKQWGGITQYVQNMSLADGVVSTLFVWLNKLQVQYEVLAHRKTPTLGVVTLKISNLGSSNVQFNVSDVLDIETSQRCRLHAAQIDTPKGIYLLYQPLGVDNVYAATYSSLRYLMSHCSASIFAKSLEAVSQTLLFDLLPGDTIEVTKYVGVVTSDLDPEMYTLFDSVLAAAQLEALTTATLPSVLASHRLSWETILASSLNVNFPDDPLLTLATRASLFHLSANTRSDSSGVTAALPVSGLLSDSYGGMVFWDTDLWILNGLLPWNPMHAKSLVNYRKHTHDQAIENLKSPLAPKTFEGAAYPWTLGRYGNCTGTGPCFDYEYHINNAVAIAAWEVYLSGAGDDDFLKNTAFPLITDAAAFLASYVEYNETLKLYTTTNLTDPDEYANHVDNGAYTNAAISATLKWALAVLQHLDKPVPDSYSKIIGNVYLPTSSDDSNIVLEYSDMNSSVGIKQADVIMITYPLENELITQDQAVANMDFYSEKQVSFGPAMTFPIFSIVASALLETGCSSQSYLSKAVQPFLRGPFAQFSEQNNDNFESNGGTHPAFPFMTAHGGLLQAVLKGLLGLRFDYRIENGKIVRFLKLDPVKLKTLPSGATFDGIQYMNHTLSMLLTGESLIVKDTQMTLNAPSKIAIEWAERRGGTTAYSLSSGEQIVIPLFETTESFPNSLTECNKAIFTNVTDGAYGDATVSVNDGDNTTHWQSNTTSGKILIDLKATTKLTKGLVNWGDRPPTHMSISVSTDETFDLTLNYLSHVDFGNLLYKKYSYDNPNNVIVSQESAFTQVLSAEVAIEAPYSAHDQAKIVLPNRYNTTTFAFPENSQARFLLLEFEGVHDDADDEGAKLYEVTLF